MVLDDEKIDFIQAFQMPGTSDTEVYCIRFLIIFRNFHLKIEFCRDLSFILIFMLEMEMKCANINFVYWI